MYVFARWSWTKKIWVYPFLHLFIEYYFQNILTVYWKWILSSLLLMLIKIDKFWRKRPESRNWATHINRINLQMFYLSCFKQVYSFLRHQKCISIIYHLQSRHCWFTPSEMRLVVNNLHLMFEYNFYTLFNKCQSPDGYSMTPAWILIKPTILTRYTSKILISSFHKLTLTEFII